MSKKQKKLKIVNPGSYKNYFDYWLEVEMTKVQTKEQNKAGNNNMTKDKVLVIIQKN